MEADRSSKAIARIDAALARIEAAPAAQHLSNTPAGAGSSATTAELNTLRARHARLRAAVQDSLHELDQLIDGAAG